MDWAEAHIKRLAKGETVTFRPRGRSMEPLVLDNQEVTVVPVNEKSELLEDMLIAGDIVLCRVRGHSYLHLIKRVDQDAKLFLIGNNRGRVNGWVGYESIFGRMVRHG